MLYADGRPITARGWYDTEALAEDGGFVYVSLERVHRILKFDYGKRGLMARATLVPVPPEMAKLVSNRGIECLAVAPKGSPVAGALDRDCGAQPRCVEEHPRVSDRRPEAGLCSRSG